MRDSLPDGTGTMAHEIGSDANIGPAAGMENKSSRPESGIKVQTEDSLTNYDEVNSSTDGKKAKTRKTRPDENESAQCSAGNNEIVLEAIDADEISSSDDDVESL